MSFLNFVQHLSLVRVTLCFEDYNFFPIFRPVASLESPLLHQEAPSCRIFRQLKIVNEAFRTLYVASNFDTKFPNFFFTLFPMCIFEICFYVEFWLCFASWSSFHHFLHILSGVLVEIWFVLEFFVLEFCFRLIFLSRLSSKYLSEKSKVIIIYPLFPFGQCIVCYELWKRMFFVLKFVEVIVTVLICNGKIK